MDKYRSTIVICKLKENKDKDALELDLPFVVYGSNIFMSGTDVTYRLHDLSNKNKEVMAKVDYRVEPHANPDIKVEKIEAEAFIGNLGQDYSKLKDAAKYKKHYSVKKADKYATYDENNVKIKYKGADANEVAKFCEWDVDPVEE